MSTAGPATPNRLVSTYCYWNSYPTAGTTRLGKADRRVRQPLDVISQPQGLLHTGLRASCPHINRVPDLTRGPRREQLRADTPEESEHRLGT